jgi:hypothetical protein
MTTSKTRKQMSPKLKWIVASIAGIAGLIGYSLWVTDYLWFQLESDALAFFMPLIWAGVILTAALPVTSFIVILMLGPMPKFGRDERLTDDELLKKGTALFQPRTLIWSGIFAMTVFGLVALSYNFSKVPGKALVARSLVPLKDVQPRAKLSALVDQRELSLLALARSKDPVQLKSFLKKSALLRHSDEMAIAAPRIISLTKHKDPSVANAACASLATLGERMTRNISLLSNKKVPLKSRWEPKVLVWLRRDVSPYLGKLLETRKDLEPGILEALAWIGAEHDGDRLLAIYLDKSKATELRVSAVTGLGIFGRDEDIPVIVSQLGTGLQLDLEMRSLWALSRAGLMSNPDSISPTPDKFVEEAVKVLAGLLKSEEPLTRCAAITVLKNFQDARVTKELTDFFDSEGSNFRCERYEIPRPWGPPLPFVLEADLRFEMLNILASIALDNFYLYKWVEVTSQQDHWKPYIKSGLMQIYSQLKN